MLAESRDDLRATVRATDVVCRIGGEVFAVILPSSDEARQSFRDPLAKRLDEVAFDLAGRISLIGIVEGPCTPRTRASSSLAPRPR